MIITTGTKVKDGEGNEYILQDELGQGGFGYVYRAMRVTDGREFAVKTLQGTFGNNEKAQSFKNEINLASAIKGQNIIEYVFAHDGETYTEMPPYIIMEYAEGGTLKELLDKQSENNDFFEKKELLDLYLQLVSGMKSINSQIVHRDIKPENILISNGLLKVSDFGLGKMAEESTRTQTFKGYGTPRYISPEAWENKENTIQMDIYSMGVVFYEMAMLRYPYEVKEYNYEVIKNAHLYSAVSGSGELKERVGVEVAAIILQMLEKSTQRRFKTWEEIESKFEAGNNKKENKLNTIVESAISKKLQSDTTKQAMIEERNRKHEEYEKLCKLVHTQFEATILTCLNDFVENYNQKIASVDLARLDPIKSWKEEFVYCLSVPDVTDIFVDCKVLTQDELERKNLNINYMGWVVVKNMNNRGFNLLLKRTDGIYGDWYVLDNYNNGSYMMGNGEKIREEPFAFSLDEIDVMMRGRYAFSAYRSDVTEFTDDEFIKRIGLLL